MCLTLNEVRKAVGSTSTPEDGLLSGVSTDTRTIVPGMLFVALKGEKFDGNAYIEQAFRNGAAAVVAERSYPEYAAKTIVVPSALEAYGKIASAWRSHFSVPVLAVTGSVGKTTMKEMIALGLSSLGPVLKSEKNENNEIGVPQTLLRLDDSHRAAVVEMGMRGFGQIKALVDIAVPDVGVVTMIGESHIELLGSRDNIADAKGELIAGLRPGATAVLNADDVYFDRLRSRTSGALASFGESSGATVRIIRKELADGVWNAVIAYDADLFELTVHSPAEHDITNAAGAAAVAVSCGVPMQEALAGISLYRPSNMRMEALVTATGATVLSDCYNAAPSSVKSALKTLASLSNSGAKLAFLGDMRELGEYTEEMHHEVAAEARRLGLQDIFTVGEHMRSAFPGARRSFSDSAAAAQFVQSGFSLSGNDAVLVKGSRALELEKIVEALVRL